MLYCFILTVILTLTTVHGLDLTVTANAAGSDVVEAVVDRIRSRCLLTDDRFLLRRLAYVESLDGQDPNTYRSDFHGGIWKVDKFRFEQTKACSGISTRPACDKIRTDFGITWQSVRWTELRKPLYSGLASVLFILSHHEFNKLPQTIDEQAKFWNIFYRPGQNREIFKMRSREIQQFGCAAQLDLAFILDGSGSIQQTQFDTVLTFVKNVTSDFPISSTGVRVAVVEYSSRVGNTITFNSHADRMSLNAAIDRITKSGQTTNTATAIDEVTKYIFTPNHGARSNAKRVVVLVTDGASGDRLSTIAAAQKAKAKGIMMFAVGIGNVIDDELAAVVSEPSCTHFYKLRNFDEVGFLVHEIKKRACEAYKVISYTPTDDTPSTVTTPLGEKPTTSTFVLNTTTDAGSPQKVIKAETECGILKIYASYDNPNPGPAFYDLTSQVADGRPSITKIETTRGGRLLYITVIATKLHESCSDVLKCKNAKYTLSVIDAPTNPEVTVVCKTWEGERSCTEADLNKAGLGPRKCPSVNNLQPDIVNTCPAASSADRVFPHPDDNTKFIICDVNGQMYVINCPQNGVFDRSRSTCNNAAIFTLTDSPEVRVNLNVCNNGLFPYKIHYPHPDTTKYIQCRGREALVRDCGEGTFYNDNLQNCVWEPSAPVDLSIPEDLCRIGGHGSKHAHSDPNKYIVCLFNTHVIMPCPVGTVWHTEVDMCT